MRGSAVRVNHAGRRAILPAGRGWRISPVMLATDPRSADLLAWYDLNARTLPWRVSPADRAAGVRPDPYSVWLSEIMLQQTTVQAVKRYFDDFTRRWPRLHLLAEAASDDVMKAWAGLGYYSRARNLKACAEIVARDHGGRFPDNEEGLRALPGIGAYTAAAIAAIAFDRPAVVVDGNVDRVIARLHAIETPMPAAKAEIRAFAARLTPAERPGDHAQAMMDLGATICTPKSPACGICPLSPACAARLSGEPTRFPVKAPKAARPVRRGVAYAAVRSDGAILLRKRPEKGLLGGMAEVPGSDWTVGEAPAAAAPLRGYWRRIGQVEHSFTHFHLCLDVERADFPAETAAPDGHWWSGANAVGGEALPSLMRKVIDRALEARRS